MATSSATKPLVDIPKDLRQYYAHLDSDDPSNHNKLKCLLPECTQIIQYRKTSGWFNLRRHLSQSHKISLEKKGNKPAETQHTLKTFLTPKWGSTSKLAKYDRNNINQLNFDLDSHLKIPSRRSISRALQREASKTKKLYRDILKSAKDGTIHLSLDLWSSLKTESVLGVKVQFVDSNWRMRLLSIEFKHFDKQSTAENLKETLKMLLQRDYVLKLEQFGVVMADNVSEMVKAFSVPETNNLSGNGNVVSEGREAEPGPLEESDADDDLGSSSDSETEDLDPRNELDTDIESSEESEQNVLNPSPSTLSTGIRVVPILPASFKRLGCTAHALQLVVKECVKKCLTAQRIESTVGKLVQFFKKSNYWKNVLFKKTKLNLIRPGATRWSSLYYAMRRLLKNDFASSLNEVIGDMRKKKVTKSTPAALSEHMLINIQDLCTLLEPLCELTNDFQADEVTSSKVIPGIISVYKFLKGLEIPEEKDFMSRFRRDLCDLIVERFAASVQHEYSGRGPKKQLLQVFKKDEYILATLLDPRIKTKPFGFAVEGTDTANNSDDDTRLGLQHYVPTKQQALEKLEQFFRLEKDAQKSRMDAGAEVEILNENEGAEPSRKKKKTYDLFALMDGDTEVDQASSASVQREREMDEVKSYLREACQNKESDPLSYWSKNAATYPILSELARKYLGIPATLGSVERLFSIAGAIARSRRARMTMVQLENLLLHKERKLYELLKAPTK